MADHELSILIRAKGAVQAARDIGKVDTALGRMGNRAGKGLATAGANLVKIGAVAAVGIGAAVKTGLDDLATLESAVTSVDGAIKAVGLTGRVTGAQIAGWANDIERDIGAAFDDKDITASTTTLLRYGKVAEENIRPAMEVMTDLAAKTGSVESASTLLAKALADPTKASGKLARAGVILTKGEQKKIAALVKAGKTADAQRVILDALTKSTEGAAAASQGPYQRALSVLADTSEDARKALAEGFLPVIEKVAGLLQTELAKPSTMANIREFGQNLAAGLDDLIDIARTLPWGQIGTSLQIAGAGAKAVLSAFSSLPPWVQTAVLTGWGLNKLTGGALGGIVGELGKGLIKGVLGMNAGVVNINAGVVNGGGDLPGGGAKPGGGKLGSIIKGAGALTIGGALFIAANEVVGANAPNHQFPGAKNRFGGNTFRVDKDQQRQLTKTNDTLSQLRKEQAIAREVTARKLAETKAAQTETKRETTRGAALMSSTTRSSASTNAAVISGAIRANRPNIQTTVNVSVTGAQVSKHTTKQERYGPGNGSSGTGHASGHGPLEY